MAITPIGIYAQATGKIATQANGQLGKDDFLKLLVAQMKYQDPLDPMSDTEFVAQMTQFSSLEQLLDLKESFTSFQSLAMIGRTIQAYAANGSIIEGKVSGVDMTTVLPALRLEDGSYIALKDVFAVK